MSRTYIATEFHYHVRSISLPSRLLHPSYNGIEAELKKISEASIDTRRSIQASAINEDLTRLVNLYNCVKELIDLPLTQKGLIHQEEIMQLENALDISIGLLDVCGSARELLLLMKENVQDLQSSMRRKGLESSSIKGQICAYICFRKRARKEISKILKSLKTMEISKFKPHLLLDNKVTKVLRELSVVTILFLRKVLLFMCPQLLKKNNVGGWSLFSRIVSNGSDREKRVMNEMEEFDISLCSLHRSIIRKIYADKGDVQKVVKSRLEEIDGGIRELEAELGCLFRCLIQHRVSLLNLLTLDDFEVLHIL